MYEPVELFYSSSSLNASDRKDINSQARAYLLVEAPADWEIKSKESVPDAVNKMIHISSAASRTLKHLGPCRAEDTERDEDIEPATRVGDIIGKIEEITRNYRWFSVHFYPKSCVNFHNTVRELLSPAERSKQILTLHRPSVLQS